jgi:hypothetical protein
MKLELQAQYECAAATLPKVLEMARLLIDDASEMLTPQFSQIMSPHEAKESPVPMNERT